MIHKIYTIYDSKAETYCPPIVVQAKGLMLRGFTEECNTPNSPYFKNPEDFTLFEVGEVDLATFEVSMYEAKQSLGLALEFKKDV